MAAVAESGALVTLLATVARRFAVSVFWHRRNDADPRLVWLREQLRACVRAIHDAG